MTTVNSENLIAIVQRLVDKDDIGRLLFDYANYLDQNKTDELAELFVEDCYIAYQSDFGAEGRAAYLATLQDERFGVGAFFAGTSHHVSNLSIDFVDAETANVRSVLYAWHRYNRERPDGIVMGQYHDVVVKTAEGWRFKRRELKHVGTENYHAKGNSLNPIERNNAVQAEVTAS